MKNTDDVHRLTESVYKNLVENFNSGIRQLLLSGKAYHKALQGVSVTAHNYNDALSRLGSTARLCRGGTEEIGEAILQIADAQREMQTQLEESTKALFTELILPLEQKLEKEFKKGQSDARKYTQRHKAMLAPYNKAHDSLKKFRKKTKNKFVYDNEKEAQFMRTLAKCQEKLDEYRLQGLKTALLEERRCHCYLLQRLCNVSSLTAVTHRHGCDLYASLPEWRDACSSPNVLPPAAEQLLVIPDDEQYEPLNGGPSYHGNGFLHRDTRDSQSIGNEFRRSQSTHDLYRRSGHFERGTTLPARTTISIPPPPTSSAQVQAVYTFAGSIDTQLSFNNGDIINIMGDKSDGWQYGQNTRTLRLGWFPLSFTQPANHAGASPSPEFRLSANQRVKSVGDLLDSRSLSEHTHYFDHDVPGNIRRPKSLYDGPQTPHKTPQAVRPADPIHTIYSTQYSLPMLPPSDPDQIYQSLPLSSDNTQQHTMYTGRDQPPRPATIYTSYGQAVADSNQNQSITTYTSQSSVPAPPLPPPPPPAPPLQAPTTSSQLQTQSNPLPANLSRLRGMTPSVPFPPPVPTNAPPLPPLPAPPPPAPPLPTTVVSKHASSIPPAPPFAPPPPKAPPIAPPLPSSRPVTTVQSMSLVSQQSPQQDSGRNPLSSTSTAGYGKPRQQQPPSKPPPPPPGPAPGNRAIPKEDYGIEEDVDYKNNPMFTNVSLRRTKTNDRSAPKV